MKNKSMRYKGVIQVEFSDKYDEAAKAFLLSYLDEVMAKEVRFKNIIKDFECKIDDLDLRKGIYEYP